MDAKQKGFTVIVVSAISSYVQVNTNQYVTVLPLDISLDLTEIKTRMRWTLDEEVSDTR